VAVLQGDPLGVGGGHAGDEVVDRQVEPRSRGQPFTPLAQHLPALGGGEERRLGHSRSRIGGQGVEGAGVGSGDGLGLAPVDLTGQIADAQVDPAAVGVHLEAGVQRGVGLLVAVPFEHFHAGGLAQPLVDVEVDEVEQGVEQRLAPRLKLRQGEPAVRQQAGLLGEEDGGQLGPGFDPQADAQRQGVQEEPEGAVAPFDLGTSVGDQAGQHVGRAGPARQHGHVGGEQGALERGSRGTGDRAQPLGGPVGHVHDEVAGVAAGGGLAGSQRPARQAARLGAGEEVLPERPRFVGGESLPLQADELPEDAGRRGLAGLLSRVGAEEPGEQGGRAPAVEHRVVEGEGELERVVGPSVDVEPREGRHAPDESAVPLRLQPGADEGPALLLR
jgi:hypothetical protein